MDDIAPIKKQISIWQTESTLEKLPSSKNYEKRM